VFTEVRRTLKMRVQVCHTFLNRKTQSHNITIKNLKSMKKLAFFLFISLWLTSCSNNTPKGIAVKFLDCLVAEEYDKAKIYCTPSGAAMLDILKTPAGSAMKLLGYKILEEETSDDKSVVRYEAVSDYGKNKASLDLTKVEGKWKVDATMRK